MTTDYTAVTQAMQSLFAYTFAEHGSYVEYLLSRVFRMSRDDLWKEYCDDQLHAFDYDEQPIKGKQREVVSLAYLIWRHVKCTEHSFILESSIRFSLVSRLSWCIPSHSMLILLLSLASKFVDLGAGNGYLSHCLRQAGAEHVIAVDDQSDGAPEEDRTEFHEVVHAEAQVYMKEHHATLGDHALLFSWPRSSSMMSECVLDSGWRGTQVFVIGEEEGGCTGVLQEEEGRIRWVRSVDIPNWYGIHDQLFVYEISHPAASAETISTEHASPDITAVEDQAS